MKKLYIITTILVSCTISCHQSYKIQWISVYNSKIKEGLVVNKINKMCSRYGLVESTDRKLFPNTIILMRDNPVNANSIDVSFRKNHSEYIIDIIGGYGVENHRFNKIKNDFELVLNSGEMGAFQIANRPIVP